MEIAAWLTGMKVLHTGTEMSSTAPKKYKQKSPPNKMKLLATVAEWEYNIGAHNKANIIINPETLIGNLLFICGLLL